MSDIISTTMEALRSNLGIALSDRVMSKDFVDFQQRRLDQLEKGIVTVLLPDMEQTDEWESTLKLMMVGQLAVPEREGTPHDIEVAELKLYQQLRAFLRNPGAGVPRLKARRIRFSSQTEFPFGWVSIELECGPLDMAADDDATGYPPTVHVSDLKAVNMDIDIPPRDSDAEHQKWLNGDYSTSQPELQIDQEFQP